MSGDMICGEIEWKREFITWQIPYDCWRHYIYHIREKISI
jgi:hypothetical protein